MKYRALTRAVESKFPGSVQAGHERNAWAEVDGVVLRVTLPKVHSRADVPPGTALSIQRQLRLDRDGFARFVACSMSGTEYLEHLRGLKGDGRL